MTRISRLVLVLDHNIIKNTVYNNSPFLVLSLLFASESACGGTRTKNDRSAVENKLLGCYYCIKTLKKDVPVLI